MKPNQDDIVAAIKKVAAELGRGPSRSEFISNSGISEYHILTHFSSWNEAVRAAGIQPDETNVRVNDDELLADWAGIVRKNRLIPTRDQDPKGRQVQPWCLRKTFWALVFASRCISQVCSQPTRMGGRPCSNSRDSNNTSAEFFCCFFQSRF